MALTGDKLLETMRQLPKADDIPAKFRAHPFAIARLRQIFTRDARVHMKPSPTFGQPCGETLLGMPFEEDGDMADNVVDVINVNGSIMKTIHLF